MPTNVVDSHAATTITMTLPPRMQLLLDSLTGETPGKKIAPPPVLRVSYC